MYCQRITTDVLMHFHEKDAAKMLRFGNIWAVCDTILVTMYENFILAVTREEYFNLISW